MPKVVFEAEFGHSKSTNAGKQVFRGGGSSLLSLSALSSVLVPAVPQGEKDVHGAWLRGFGGTGSVKVSKIGSDVSLSTGGVIGRGDTDPAMAIPRNNS